MTQSLYVSHNHDLSSLSAKQCDDPGTPPGATQEQLDGTYEQDQRVTFTCDEEGFELDDDTELTCVLTNGDAGWGRPLPNCVGAWFNTVITLITKILLSISDPK